MKFLLAFLFLALVAVATAQFVYSGLHSPLTYGYGSYAAYPYAYGYGHYGLGYKYI